MTAHVPFISHMMLTLSHSLRLVKYSFVGINKITMDLLSRLSAGKWLLFTSAKNEGRREHLSMSLPSLEYYSVAHPVSADIHAGKQEERAACLSCYYHIAYLETCLRGDS